MTTFGRRAFLIAGVVVLIIVLQWELVALPATPSEERGTEAWSLPTIAKPPPRKALEILGKASLWGRVAPLAADSGATQASWRFLGVVQVAGERTLVIQVGDQPARQIKAGELLPGGSKVLKIEQDAFIVLENGKKRIVEIYQQGPLGL